MNDLINFEDVADEPTTEATKHSDTPSTDATNPFCTGDPVMDAAQGRPMVVLNAPNQTVAEWSEANNYDLTENYANSKFDAVDDEFVVRCAYVSDVRSEPSKDYTFPVSRVRLIDAHHADDGMRVADRVAVDLLERLYGAAIDHDHTPTVADVAALVAEAGVDEDVASLGQELAKAERVSSDE